MRNIYSKAADGTGLVECVTTSDTNQTPSFWSADGQILVIEDSSDDQTRLRSVSLAAENPIDGLIETEFSEFYGEVSPDGRWIVHTSNESGLEVYVRPFPNVDDGRWQISRGNSYEPVLAPDGRKLFYRLQGSFDMMVVSIETEPTLSPGNPETLFAAPYRFGAPNRGRPWDVARDGRFLMVKNTGAAESAEGCHPRDHRGPQLGPGAARTCAHPMSANTPR